MKPTTNYTKSGALNIAYQVIDKGPIDLVFVPGWVSNIDLMWEDPRLSDFLTRLSSFARLILFDKRGTGLSDRVSETSTLEERMEDIGNVMDAANCEKAVLFGHSEGGTVSTLFAATYPQRTIALVTFGIFAKRRYSVDYPWAPKDEERQKYYQTIEGTWGNPEKMGLERIMPSMANDKEYRESFARYLRSAASPGTASALSRMNRETDITNILSSVKVPTLVLHRTGDKVAKIEEAKFIADRIPNSKLVELAGEDHLFWIGDTYSVIAEIEEFITGVRPSKVFDRVLSTIMFTDIVSSTEHLTRLGDEKWMNVLNQHNQIVRKQISRFNGREIKSTGDGFLATFKGPSKAILCAESIREEVKALDIEITAGIHTGECEIYDENDIGGIAVHVASRVLSKAEPGQILVTMTVKYLLGGTGLEFTDLGEVPLKGIDEDFRLFALKG